MISTISTKYANLMHFHENQEEGVGKTGETEKQGKQGERKVSQWGGEELVADLVGGLGSYPTSKLHFVSRKCNPACYKLSPYYVW